MSTLILDSTTKTIKVSMAASAATTNPDFTVAYADNTGTNFTEAAADGALNGTSDVTLVSAPSSGSRRVVKHISIHNRDTQSNTITLKYDNNGTQRTIAKVTLSAGETWTSLAAYDSLGNVKQALAVSDLPSGTTLNGSNIATLDGSGKVPTAQLPSYVDDVVEGANLAAFPATGETGKIYVAIDTGKVYRWTGSVYVEISTAPAALSGRTDSASPSITALGYQAGSSITTGLSGTFIGYQAGKSVTTGYDNIAVGVGSLFTNTSGSANISIGDYALYATNGGANNISIGGESLYSNTTGSANIAIGTYALYSKETGGSNIALGDSALNNATNGSNNVAIGDSAGGNITTGQNNVVIGTSAQASSATVSNEITIGHTTHTKTRIRGIVELGAAMIEQGTVSATAATGTINFDVQTQSVLYYTSNASANWTLNLRASSTATLDSVMPVGDSITIAFLATNGATAYRQTALTVDGASVTPKWQGGTAPTAGNASSIDAYVITVIKTAANTYTALASLTKFA